jgi:uncharacterized protein (TIGR00730 family)
MSITICVFGASSSLIDPIYHADATMLGKEIAHRDDTLLFGAGANGLMGTVARAAQQNGGRIIGIIPEALNQTGMVYQTCDELIVTKGLRERKAIMDARSDAFIALPGGFGTMEELLEIITLKQLGYHAKPIVILNTNDYYRKLLAQFDTMIGASFAEAGSINLYRILYDPIAALNYIASKIDLLK